MIDILMATYNGELYLENQILSLISQTFKDWNLLIHDDGSSDKTMDIIHKYQMLDSRIKLFEDNICFGDAGKNFIHLLQFSKSEYIVFCDQDDIWLESKLLALYSEIKEMEDPFAVYCNAYGYNGFNITTERVSLIERNDLSNSLFLNSGVQGCSLMFNRKLLNILLDSPPIIYMHDHYITMGAIAFGKLQFIDESLMLYRQHNLNVTGNVPVTFSDRIRSFLNKNNPIIDRKHYEANKSFLQHFKKKLTDHQVKTFEAYINFPNLNTLNKIRTVFQYNFNIGDSKMVLLIKIIFKKII